MLESTQSTVLGRRSGTRMILTLALALAVGLLLALAPAWAVAGNDSTVFINEIHYDNTGTDVGEFIEVAGPEGTDLSQYSLVLYNGSNGASYNTRALTGTIAPQQGGYGTASFDYPVNGIQNGSPDGIALVGPNGLIQFLSYEGTFAAVGGPADGQTSTDIGASELGTEPVGQSLQLQGQGRTFGDFRFAGPIDDTPGQPNTDQTFGEPAPPVDPPEVPGNVRIHDIQGASQQTPFFDNDRTNDGVENVPGVITAFRDFGFFMQDDQPDNDPATSEGIFVFTGSNSVPENTFKVNDRVLVDGSVNEFRPGGDQDNLTVTQITSSVARVTDTDLTGQTGTIAPTVIGPQDQTGLPVGTQVRTPPTGTIEDDTNGDVEDKQVTTGTTSDTSDPNNFEPNEDGIDFFESLEGMLVQVNDPVVVGPSERRGFGEIPVLANDGAGSDDRTTGGGIEIDALEDQQPEEGPGASPDPTDTRRSDQNPERIIFDDEVLKDIGAGSETTPLVPANVGDSFQNQALNGVIDYSFGNFKAQLTADPGATNDTERERETTRLPGADELAVGEFSMENLSPTPDDDDTTDTNFQGAATEIVTALRSPDIVALTEVQDNDGDQNSTVTDASETARQLIAAIKAAGGPDYQYTDIDPADDQDGGEPGGNIRVAYLYREDRGLDFVERPGGTPTTDTTVTQGANGPQLSASPGRIDPQDPSFVDSRKPLVGEFTYNGRKLIVVQNHFNSKGEDSPLFGRFQPPILRSEEQRNQQAQAVRDFVDQVLNVDPNARVIVLGDLNDFEFSRPLEILRGDDTPQAQAEGSGNLENLVDTVPDNDRYTFVFNGNSQVLDHMLISPSLQADTVNGGAQAATPDFDIVHASAEFADRRSDHDGQVGFFNLPAPPDDPDDPDDPAPTPKPACSDGRDNDGDGKVDLKDPGCSSRSDDSERNQPQPEPPRPDPRGCTITGTNGNDALRGTPRADVICGLGGNDAIKGLGGNDVIYGDAGNDAIQGNSGGDRLLGGSGNDALNGGDGADRIVGGSGRDALAGDGGNDRLDSRDGKRGNDANSGGPGRDTFRTDRGDAVRQ